MLIEVQYGRIHSQALRRWGTSARGCADAMPPEMIPAAVDAQDELLRGLGK
jgi:hypothetical protein